MTGETKALIALAIVTVAVFISGVFIFNSSESKSKSGSEEQPVPAEKLVRSDSYKIESKEAKVTVVEFLDFECEACRAADPVVKQMLEEYKGKITFVVRYFPLSGHRKSQLAANAAEAAGAQGKFWEMKDMLFTRQDEWGNAASNVPDEKTIELFGGYAQELGLDTERFKKEVTDRTYQKKVLRDLNEGVSLGVNATPTFFINGIRMSGVPRYEELKEKIEAGLQE
jgi:protein-disulfide isomerase